MNRITLTGRLARDPEFIQTANGTEITSFTVAVQRNFRNANGEYETDFINCKCFKGQAVFVKTYFNKGGWIEVEGSLQIRSYDGNDGIKRQAAEVICDRTGFVGLRSDANHGGTSTPPRPQTAAQGNVATPAATFTEAVDEDDLPF